MKRTNVLTPLLAFACLLLWAALQIRPEAEDYRRTRQLRSELKFHQDSMNRLNEKNKVLKAELLALKNQKDSLLKQITIHKQNIQQLKNNQNEKVSRISQLNAIGLYRFFAGFNTGR